MKNTNVENGSPDRFGYEWVNYSQMKNEYEVQFNRWTPFMRPSDWRGISFLDVGCGMGRNSFWPLSYGASKALCIDVNRGSLNSAKNTLKAFDNAQIEFCSAYDISAQNEFDVAFSLGVIHHLEFPVLAIQKMVQAVKPGGLVFIWVYGYEKNEWIVRFFDPIRKLIFSRLPIAWTHHLAIYPTIFLFIALKLLPFKLEYYVMLKRFDFGHLRSIVFDQMLPKIANYWTKDEVMNLMKDGGLFDLEVVAVNGMSWAAKGTKK